MEVAARGQTILKKQKRLAAFFGFVHFPVLLLVFPLVAVDDDLAIRAALLEPLTRASGLGSGDRICLALAGRLGVPAVTADRPWTGPAAPAGVVPGPGNFDLLSPLLEAT